MSMLAMLMALTVALLGIWLIVDRTLIPEAPNHVIAVAKVDADSDPDPSVLSTESSQVEPPRVPVPGPVVLGARIHISGTVRCKQTAAFVVGANIYVAPEHEPTRLSDCSNAISDDQGQFHNVDVSLPARIVVRAAGFVPSVLDISADVGPLEILLGRGESVSGVVTDHLGVGIPGVKVIAAGPTAVGLYRLPNSFAVPANCMPNYSVGVSDGFGRFVITGLGEGRVRVQASRFGWRHMDPSGSPTYGSGSEASSLLPSNALICNSGTSGLRIVLEPVWAVALRVLSDETGQVIELERVRVAQRASPPKREQRWLPVWGDDDDWFASDDSRYWAFRGYFVRREFPGDDTMRLTVSAVGYERKVVEVKPLHPDESGYAEPQVVRLAPVAPEGVLDLVVTLAGKVYSEPLVVRFVDSTKSLQGIAEIKSRQVGEGGVRNFLLPIGDYKMQIVGTPGFLTITSPPATVTVPASGRGEAQINIGAGWLDVDVRDRSGARLVNAKITITLIDEKKFKSWRLQIPSARPLVEQLDPAKQGLFQAMLKPGSYSVAVACFGFVRQENLNVGIARGERTSLQLTLESED